MNKIILVVAIVSIIVVGSIGFWLFMGYNQDQWNKDFNKGLNAKPEMTSYESCMQGLIIGAEQFKGNDQYCSQFDNTIKR